MGKYMRKAKITGEVAVMEVSHQSSLGVRTRAKTLALQRLQKDSPDPSSSYLELRSRRLEKPLPPKPKEVAGKESPKRNPNPSPSPSSKRAGPVNSGSVGSASMRSNCSKKEEAITPENDAGVEVSFGENVLEIEVRSRNARETTPCSPIRDSETMGTPGSTTKPTNTTTRRIQSSTRRNIPTSLEMEEFFSGAEKLQQKTFKEKYNFDPVDDCPLPGRYEWVKLEN